MFHARSIQSDSRVSAPAHAAYRRDIDGLRAIAVLSVVGFHAFPRFVRSGFVGVDIFFVISGFLISTIIFTGVESGQFSFADFYARRVRRIFPALILVLIASFAFGWFFLFADEFKQLGKEMAGGAGFVANLVFLNENSYFDVNILLKPLVHLWSLGIEEQYYIVWPLLIWAAARWRINLMALTLAIAAVSLFLSIRGVDRDAVFAFYSPQTRFWELLAGSALAYVALHRAPLRAAAELRLRGAPRLEAWWRRSKPGTAMLSEWQSIVGLYLIARSIVFTDPHDFPGLGAVPTIVGTVLIISAGSLAWINRVVLSSRIMVGFGLISFPLYLWHWPLLSFDTIVTGATPTTDARILAVIAAMALAWATMRFIERPLRFSKSAATAPALVAAMIVVGLAGYGVFRGGGLEGYGFRTGDKTAFASYFDNSLPQWRYFEREGIPEKFRLDCDFVDPSYRYGPATDAPRAEIAKSCYVRDPTKDKVLFLWGDSHVQMLYPGLRNALPANWQIMIVAASGCAPKASVTEDSATRSCQRSNWFALSQIRQTRPDAVIVSQRDERDVGELQTIERELADNGVGNILMLGPVPQWAGSLPKIIMRRLWDATPERTFVGMDESVIAENQRIGAALKSIANARYVDLYKFFCNIEGCLTRVGPDKLADSVTYDYGHLTPLASDYLAKNLLAKLVVNPGAGAP
jgi:peptidoglycan/LPS O-acetylase OafA/YrhL